MTEAPALQKLSKSMTNKTKSVGGQLEQTETPPDPTLSYYYWTLHSHTIERKYLWPQMSLFDD